MRSQLIVYPAECSWPLVHLLCVSSLGQLRLRGAARLAKRCSGHTPNMMLCTLMLDPGRGGFLRCGPPSCCEVSQPCLTATVCPASPAGAFNMTTGPAHWELLQKARAVDNQLFVATCSPARRWALLPCSCIVIRLGLPLVGHTCQAMPWSDAPGMPAGCRPPAAVPS